MATDEKFTPKDLETALDDLSTMKYFPQHSRAAIMRQVAAMCPHKRALRYLVDQCLAHVAEWPGIAELRGILCNKFDPADGVNAWSSLPGFTATDGEAISIAGHEETKRQWQKAASAFFGIPDRKRLQ